MSLPVPTRWWSWFHTSTAVSSRERTPWPVRAETGAMGAKASTPNWKRTFSLSRSRSLGLSARRSHLLRTSTIPLPSFTACAAIFLSWSTSPSVASIMRKTRSAMPMLSMALFTE